MAAHRYWRAIGIMPWAEGDLELSEFRLYSGSTLSDSGAALLCSHLPKSGALSDLYDGNAATSVIWDGKQVESPGFYLMWDFGAGADANITHVRLGQGASRDKFPLDFSFQCSDDGKFWRIFRIVTDILPPGPNSLTAAPSGGADGDDYYAFVTFLLNGNYMPGTALVDASSLAQNLTAIGSADYSLAQSRYGTRSLYLSGAQQVSIPNNVSIVRFDGAFTIEAHVYLLATKAGHELLDARSGGGSATAWVFHIDAGKVSLFLGGTSHTGATTVSINTWHHIAVARVGSTIKIFLDGVEDYSGTSSSSIIGSSAPIYIGGKDGSLYTFYGYINGLRITNGVGRYASDFTPAVSPYSEVQDFIPVSARVPRAGKKHPGFQLLSGVPQPAIVAYKSDSPFVFRDEYNGGRGIIYGSVKEKNTPVNVPWRRKVLLLDEASQIVIRQTWSDSVTGAYEFQGIKMGVKYTVWSYDYTGGYRAAIADGQIPELMA